jgi:CBS domain-containing protein/sporulation protein YlmC with PRC-barrel domain
MFRHFPSIRSAHTFPLDSLLSVAGLLGARVIHKDGQEVGRLVDLVCRWDQQQRYPLLSGILVKVGRRVVWIPANEIAHITFDAVNLKTARLDLRDFQPRSGEACLATDVLDHQLVDVEGARVVRAADLYITVSGGIRLVAVDVSYLSLLRRLLPRRWRKRPYARSVIDWSTIQSFGQASDGKSSLRLSATSRELQRLKPAELADLLEDLGRAQRQELLQVLPIEQAADALEEMQAEELESLLRESTPEAAASYLAKMEPDEAADALRDIDGEFRDQLIARLPKKASERVTAVLAHRETTAGGIMNSGMVIATKDETIKDIADRLRHGDKDESSTSGVVVVDGKGRFVDDLNFGDLFVASPNQKIESLVHKQPPEVVNPEDSLDTVADCLITNRQYSILVVDNNRHPLGRILADDIIDAFMPEDGRFHFPRIFS